MKFIQIIFSICSIYLLVVGCGDVSDTSSNSETADPPAICGDGVVDEAEGCDDGNTLSEACDYGELDCVVCRDDCSEGAGATSYCGDGIINGAEVCDDGEESMAFSPEHECFMCSAILEQDCAGFYIHPSQGPVHSIDECGVCNDISSDDCTIRDNGDGTNSDLVNDMMWMKCSQGMTFNASSNTCEGNYSTFEFCVDQSACSACKDLVYAGYMDWVVPTHGQLQQITQSRSGSAQQIDTSLFPNIPLRSHWSSEIHSGNSSTGYAWNVDLGTGLSHSEPYYYDYPVLCVREDNPDGDSSDTTTLE